MLLGNLKLNALQWLYKPVKIQIPNIKMGVGTYLYDTNFGASMAMGSEDGFV
jgi:hypothetical protein